MKQNDIDRLLIRYNLLISDYSSYEKSGLPSTKLILPRIYEEAETLKSLIAENEHLAAHNKDIISTNNSMIKIVDKFNADDTKFRGELEHRAEVINTRDGTIKQLQKRVRVLDKIRKEYQSDTKEDGKEIEQMKQDLVEANKLMDIAYEDHSEDCDGSTQLYADQPANQAHRILSKYK